LRFITYIYPYYYVGYDLMECNRKKIPLTKVNLLSYALRIKSTLENLIKMLADPSRPILLTIHNDRSELYNSWDTTTLLFMIMASITMTLY
jgi:hypothetical protein